MDQLVQQFFNLEIMRQAWPMLLSGLGMTATICAIVIPVGVVAGIATALLSLSRWRIVRWPAVAFVDLFRALPPLVLLIFVYSGLPFAGIRPSPLQAVTIGFLLNNAAYYGEIYRAGILSIGKGQTEAARSTGLTSAQSMVHVILPQAVRNVLPDLVSNTIEVVKLTSLASVVSLAELLYQADMARSVTYNASPIVAAALLYLVILWPLVRLVSRLERRIAT